MKTLLKFKKYFWLPILLIVLIPKIALAQEDTVPRGGLEGIFKGVVDALSHVIYFKIGGENGIPFIVLWLIAGAIFFTLRMKFGVGESRYD